MDLASVCPVSELLSLAGPEVVMVFFGALTYIIFSGKNLLFAAGTHQSSGNCNASTQLCLQELQMVPLSISEEERTQKKCPETVAANDEEEAEPVEKVSEKKQTPLAVGVLRASASCFLEAVAGERLSTDIQAQVLLCLELSHVGVLAQTCRTAKAGIWEQAPLWLALGGPRFAPAYQLLSGGAAAGELDVAPLRQQFRTWIYGLDDASWGEAFAEKAVTAHHAELFGDAAYLVGGLEAQDFSSAKGAQQLEHFRTCLLEQLTLLDTADEPAREAAERLLLKVEQRGQRLLGTTFLAQLHQAFNGARSATAKLEAWAMMRHLETEEEAFNPFALEEEQQDDNVGEDEEAWEERPATTSVSGSYSNNDSLALSFLAALRNHTSNEAATTTIAAPAAAA